MGENLIKGAKFQLVNKNGETLEIQNVDSIEIKESKQNNDFENFLNENGMITGRMNYDFEVTLNLGGISRKRFIKLLMGHGIARNGAVDIANYYWKRYGYYSERFIAKILF